MRAGERPRAAIVGAGLMGRWHADAARRAGGVVVGVADPDVDRAALLARRAGGVRAERELAPLLRGGAVDVVHICSPLATHLPLALAALEAGCHVLVEKPLAPSLEAADRLLSAAGSRRLLLTPVHQFLFQRGVLTAAARLPSLGPLRHLEMEVCSAGAERPGASRDEVALEILPHALALAARFSARAVDEGEWRCGHPADGELHLTGTVGGVGVSARISMRGRPPVNRLRLVAERGTIHADLFHGFAVEEAPGTSRLMKVMRPLLFATRLGGAAAGNLARRALSLESAYPGLRELVRRFYSSAVTGGANPIPVAETRAVTAVWERLRRQLETAARPSG